jgi:hypothetical protein
MTITFPALRPSSREATLARYPVTEASWREDAACYTRPWSDNAVDTRLRLEFRNIADTSAASILQCWYASLSGALPIALPAALADGILDANLANKMLSPSGLSWHFAEAPSITSVIPGISTAQVNLVATADKVVNQARLSSNYFAVSSGSYTIYLNYTSWEVRECTNRFCYGAQLTSDQCGGGSTSLAGASVSTAVISNPNGIYKEFEVVVPKMHGKICGTPEFSGGDSAEDFTTRVYGVKEDQTRILVFSQLGRITTNQFGNLIVQQTTVRPSNVSIGFKKVGTNQKIGPFFNFEYAYGYRPGMPLGMSNPDAYIPAQEPEINYYWFEAI